MCKCFINSRGANAPYKNHLKSSNSTSVFIVTSSRWSSYFWVSVHAHFYAVAVRGAVLTEQALCLQMIHGNTNKECSISISFLKLSDGRHNY